MGHHKYNPTAIAAKNGELPPKEKSIGKRDSERLIYEKCKEILYKPFNVDGENLLKNYYDNIK